MLDVGAAQLFTVEIGAGPEVAVLLHGGPGASHDYLRPQLDALAGPGPSPSTGPSAGQRRIFYYDQRGGGRSPLPTGTPYATVADHVADLEAVRRHLAQERLTLVGYSWGALLALSYALAHPRQVARLALISPAPAAAREREEARRRLAAAAQRPSVAALRDQLGPAPDRRARFALAVAGYFADPRRALELTPFIVRQGAEEAVWRSLGEYDLRPQLSALDCPAWVAHGTEDPIPLESAARTAAALSAELLVLERCGHVPYVEAPDRLLPSLRAFLNQGS